MSDDEREKFARGGYIRKSEDVNDIPARLSDCEYLLRPAGAPRSISRQVHYDHVHVSLLRGRPERES